MSGGTVVGEGEPLSGGYEVRESLDNLCFGLSGFEQMTSGCSFIGCSGIEVGRVGGRVNNGGHACAVALHLGQET